MTSTTIVIRIAYVYSYEEIVSQQDQISKSTRSLLTVIDIYPFHHLENLHVHKQRNLMCYVSLHR